ncbi:GNAT family N-acetyltransferase [Streptococcus sp. DD13]|uniref:GNAT family N-acetyltransferase n=1 Tax=Streptococcus sp. DD13 TaxID=1777881 RepID=UPI000797053A|nr:GNAT family N-acetyltransferase [Streptococcus sp. DD13]KXT77819.1 Acetyltransferase [Streptococcus sp. DD13]
MELRRPTLADKDAILAMMAEFEEEASLHDGGFWDWEDFVYEDWLASNQDAEMGLHLPDGWVPAIQLVGFEDGVAVGFLNLRLRLSDYLLNEGGHIGYSIRPSERGKGYAKESLRQGLQVAKEKNINKVLVTCSVANSASRAVILANGGQREDIRYETERYWIDLEEENEQSKTTRMEE